MPAITQFLTRADADATGQAEKDARTLPAAATADTLFLAVKIWRLLLADAERREGKKAMGADGKDVRGGGVQKGKAYKAVEQFCKRVPHLLPASGRVEDLFEPQHLQALSGALTVRHHMSCFSSNPYRV